MMNVILFFIYYLTFKLDVSRYELNISVLISVMQFRQLKFKYLIFSFIRKKITYFFITVVNKGIKTKFWDEFFNALLYEIQFKNAFLLRLILNNLFQNITVIVNSYF